MPKIRLAPAARSTEPAQQLPSPPIRPPGITSGTPPLPIGKAVRIGGGRTPAEQHYMETGEVPANLKKAINDVSQEMRQTTKDLPLAVDPATPRVDLNVVDIDSLPRNRQAEVRKAMSEMTAGDHTAGPPAAEMPADPIGRHFQNAQQHITGGPQNEVAAKINQARKLDLESEPVDRPPAPDQYIPNVNGNAPAAAAPAQTSDTGTHQQTCPHCAWDLSKPDDPMPTDDEKSLYIASILGEKPFQHTYSVLGGKVQITLRELAPRENDAIFQLCYAERRASKLTTEMDFFERVNRLRLCLQLVRVRSDQFDHELPDGLNKQRNPHAHEFWDETAGENDYEEIDRVEKCIMDDVLKAESVYRIARQLNGRFNRLVARLEVAADSPNFYTATGVQS